LLSNGTNKSIANFHETIPLSKAAEKVAEELPEKERSRASIDVKSEFLGLWILK
jgi:hypothetical protein